MNVPKFKHAIVYLFIHVGFLQVVYNCCYWMFNAEMLTSYFVIYCDVTHCVIIRYSVVFQTPPLLLNILTFFQKATLNNHSVMCHCKCIIAQVQSAWMPACLRAWKNFQWKVMKWQ